MGRCSNLSDQGERLHTLVEMAPSEVIQPIGRKPKQVQRRLRPAEIEELVAAYHTGATVYELGALFRINRRTVSIILERQGVPRRYRMMEGDRLSEAISAYNSGKSLAAVGADLGVSMDTVRLALLKAGVELRPRPGWHY